MITVENLADEYFQANQSERLINTEKEGDFFHKKVGDILYVLPEETPNLAFLCLTRYVAQHWSEGLQRIFTMTYPDITRKIIEDELQEIYEFIEKAKKRNFGEAFKISVTKGHYTGSDWLDIKNDKELEYLRLTEGGYYKVNMCDTAINSTASQVYGRYILFRQWLEKQLANLSNQEANTSSVDQQGKVTDSPKQEQPDRSQNFLNVIASIEQGILRRCNNNITLQRKLNPTDFEPIKTLWERIGDSESVAARNSYRETIKGRTEFALSHISSVYIRNYETDLQKQPDKQSVLILQHREKLRMLLDESYPSTIQDWFYRFWIEEEQAVERIDDLEMEVFHFCYDYNKPFMVGLQLMQGLYGYCIAIERLNRMLPSNDTEPSPKDIVSSVSDTEKLTQREKALIHCYRQMPPIKRGEPMYNDYIALATPRKRLAYPNDSKKKAGSLIESIERILQHLSDIERQQAESEIKTIESKFS